jgi:hypothetical protein
MKSVAVKIMLVATVFFVANCAMGNDSTKVKRRVADDVTLKLPSGFTAVVIADKVGSNRHIAVNTNGDLYVKLEKAKNGKGILVLKLKLSIRSAISGEPVSPLKMVMYMRAVTVKCSATRLMRTA